MDMGPDEGFSNADWDEYFEGESRDYERSQRLQYQCDEDPLLDLLVNGAD